VPLESSPKILGPNDAGMLTGCMVAIDLSACIVAAGTVRDVAAVIYSGSIVAVSGNLRGRASERTCST
jgi:hypothetical protein